MTPKESATLIQANFNLGLLFLEEVLKKDNLTPYDRANLTEITDRLSNTVKYLGAALENMIKNSP